MKLPWGGINLNQVAMIKVEAPGFFTTIQDKGRFAYRHLGVPVAGPMDQHGYDLAMALLPHIPDGCVFECTLIGPTLRLTKEVRFVVTGAPISINLDGAQLAMNKVHLAPVNSLLKLGKVEKGMRSYLRFGADLGVPTILDSKSFYSPLTAHKSLQKGDVFSIENTRSTTVMNHALLRVNDDYITATNLVVSHGPDWGLLSTDQQLQLLNETHKVEAQNRMGYRLSSTIRVNAPALLSQLVVPGMVQLTPGGKLLIATADCQVTGGYLQVLRLHKESLDVLVQKREGEILTFRNKLR